MANLDKNQPKGYGNDVKMGGNPAPDMKSNGSVKNRIPDAMTNKVGKDAKFDGGKSSGTCYTHDRKSYQ
jgi:hypothetical protein